MRERVRERVPEFVCTDIDPQPPGSAAAVYQFVSSFFSAQLGGNKQPCSPTLDHTLLSNSTLVGRRVERGWRDRIEIREEEIKAFISPEYRSLTRTSAHFTTLITAMHMLQSSSNGLNVGLHIGYSTYQGWQRCY